LTVPAIVGEARACAAPPHRHGAARGPRCHCRCHFHYHYHCHCTAIARGGALRVSRHHPHYRRHRRRRRRRHCFPRRCAVCWLAWHGVVETELRCCRCCRRCTDCYGAKRTSATTTATATAGERLCRCDARRRHCTRREAVDPQRQAGRRAGRRTSAGCSLAPLNGEHNQFDVLSTGLSALGPLCGLHAAWTRRDCDAVHPAACAAA
jgi:hypothetical protein